MEDSDHQSTQSGAFIGSNDDLLTEILLRLPVASILRFKSVSKHWRRLLNHTSFTLRYDNRNHSNSHGLFVRNVHIRFSLCTSLLSLHYCYDPRGIRVVQSCNGLLLCCSDLGKKTVRRYHVLNPTTQQFAVIPPVPPGCRNGESVCFMGLAFDKKDCERYKVVCICWVEPLGKSLQIQVYSSDTKKWKVSVESFSSPLCNFEKGVYWNGAIHFAPREQTQLFFEIGSERLQSLRVSADMLSAETKIMHFGECKGYLHLVTSDSGERLGLHLNVYEMLGDGSGWFMKDRVELDGFQSAYPRIISPRGYRFHVVAVVRGEKEEDTFMVVVIPGSVVRYNLHVKRSSHICHQRYDDFYAGGPNVHHHTKTIASI